MLLLPKNYSVLETCKFIETEKETVCELLATCDQMFFVDTCLMSRIYLKDRVEDIVNYLELFCSENTVVVFTETLICELTPYTTGGMISQKLINIFEKLNEKFSVVLFKEEWLGSWRKHMVDESDLQVNQKFREDFRKYKALLPKLDKYANDSSQSFHKVLYDVEVAGDAEEFIEEVILFIKSKKVNGDSLAELLVFLCALYIMDLYEADYEEKAFVFLTADRKAAARVKDLQNHSDMFLQTFDFLTVGHLVSQMYTGKMFENDESAKQFVRDVLRLSATNDKLKVVIYQPGALQMVEKVYSTEEFISLLKTEDLIKIIY